MKIVLRLLPLILAVTGCDPASEILSLSSDEAVVTVEPDPFRLVVEAADGVRVAQSPAMTFLDGGGAADELTAVESTTLDGETLRVIVATSSGGRASVDLTWTGARSLRVAVTPPEGGDVASIGDGVELEEGERIYGLTERLRDSNVMSEDTNGPMVEDMFPVEEGSLDRRGETVEMFVRPTMSLSSRSSSPAAATASGSRTTRRGSTTWAPRTPGRYVSPSRPAAPRPRRLWSTTCCWARSTRISCDSTSP